MVWCMLKNFFRRIPLFESIRAFLEQWGLWGWVGVVATSAFGFLYTWGAWAFYAVPVWLLPLLFLGCLALVAVIFYYGLLAKQWIRAYRLDLPDLGGALNRFL